MNSHNSSKSSSNQLSLNSTAWCLLCFYSFTMGWGAFSTGTAASQTVVHKGIERISLILWRHMLWMQTLSCPSFFLCMSSPPVVFLQELCGLLGSARTALGMPSAGVRQRASCQPTLGLQAVCAPSLLWQYDERNTFTLIMSPCFSKDSPFLLFFFF